MVARVNGHFPTLDKRGLDVDLQLIDSSQGIAALLSGQTQFADVGGSETLAAAAAGGGLVVLANLTPLAPYVFYAAPGVTDAAQLKGKKVGDTNTGASLEIADHLALKQLNLDPTRDVTLVNTQRSYAAANRSVTQRYIDSIVEAIGREKKDRAFAVSVLKKYFKSSDDSLMGAAYDFYAREVVQQPPSCSAAQFAEARNVLGATLPAVRAYQLGKLYDNSYVKSAVDRGLAKA